MIRQHAEAVYASLRTATRLLVHQLGGIDAAAAGTRVARSRISDYGNPAGELFIPADVAMDLEALAGEPLITAVLARVQGYTLVPTEARQEGDLPLAMARISREFAGFVDAAARAMRDNIITEAERSEMLRWLENVRRVTADASAVVAALPAGTALRLVPRGVAEGAG